MGFSRRNFVASCLAGLPLAGKALAEGGAQSAAPPGKIGALLPLSGPDSLLGDESLRGIQLAVDAIDALNGPLGSNLALLAGDALGEDRVEQVAKAMIAGQGVELLLGTGAARLAYAGSDAAELAQIPYIELNAQADGITARNFKFLLRTTLTTSMQAAVAVQAAAQKFAGARIGLLFNTGASAGAVAAAALAQWQAAKISPRLVVGYPEDAADLHDPVSRMQRAGVGLVLHAGSFEDVPVLFQALQDIGWRPGVIGCGEGYGFRETAFAIGDLFDTTYISAAPFYPPSAAGIADAYQNRFGMPPRSADSLTSYAGAKLVLDALAAVNGDTGKLLDRLHKTELAAGTLANGWGVAFDKTGQNTRAFATLQQWRNGALIRVT